MTQLAHNFLLGFAGVEVGGWTETDSPNLSTLKSTLIAWVQSITLKLQVAYNLRCSSRKAIITHRISETNRSFVSWVHGAGCGPELIETILRQGWWRGRQRARGPVPSTIHRRCAA